MAPKCAPVKLFEKKSIQNDPHPVLVYGCKKWAYGKKKANLKLHENVFFSPFSVLICWCSKMGPNVFALRLTDLMPVWCTLPHTLSPVTNVSPFLPLKSSIIFRPPSKVFFFFFLGAWCVGRCATMMGWLACGVGNASSSSVSVSGGGGRGGARSRGIGGRGGTLSATQPNKRLFASRSKHLEFVFFTASINLNRCVLQSG